MIGKHYNSPRSRWGILLSVLAFAVGGCSSSGVYRELDGWLVCENARPQYHAYYDVFYVAPEAYSGRGDYPYAAHDQALEETTRMFGKHVRIFAPIYHDRRDVEKAFWHYIDTYHGNGLPWPMNDERSVAAKRYGREHADWDYWRPIFESRPKETCCNLMITLINQTKKLLDGMIARQEEDFKKFGGVRERMHAARTAARGEDWDKSVYSRLDGAENGAELETRAEEIRRKVASAVWSIKRRKGWA